MRRSRSLILPCRKILTQPTPIFTAALTKPLPACRRTLSWCCAALSIPVSPSWSTSACRLRVAGFCCRFARKESPRAKRWKRFGPCRRLFPLSMPIRWLACGRYGLQAVRKCFVINPALAAEGPSPSKQHFFRKLLSGATTRRRDLQSFVERVLGRSYLGPHRKNRPACPVGEQTVHDGRRRNQTPVPKEDLVELRHGLVKQQPICASRQHPH